MSNRTPEERAVLIQLAAGALSGFGDAVAAGKIPPEKAAHKAVVMAESAVKEIDGETRFGEERREQLVFEKPDR